ncbi:PAS domain-containing protein, partial [Streptomyces sp. NPDC001356]
MTDVAAMAVIDAHGTVTGWTEGARLLTGHPAEEVVGRQATDLLAEDLPGVILTARAGPVAVRHRDGHRLVLPLTVCPLAGAAGRPAGYVVTALPPGASLAAQAFEQASMSMSVFDLRQRYLRVNAAACHAMGVPEEALLGRSFPDTVADTEHSRGFLARLREVAETGRPVRYESYSGAPALDQERAWSIEMWPLRDASGEPAAVALAASDSSEQYWARRRLALLNEAATCVGTTLDVIGTAEEMVALLVPQYADFASVDLLDWVLGPDEPPTPPDGGVVLRRVAHGSTRPGNPAAALHLGETDVYQPASPPA